MDEVSFELVEEAEFLERYKQENVVNTFINNAEAMAKALEQSGKPNTRMNRYMHLYPNTMIEDLVQYTNQQLAKAGKTATEAFELRQVISLYWRTQYKVSSDFLWSQDLALAAEKNNFTLISHNQWIDVLWAVRGCPVVGQDGNGGGTWTSQNTPFAALAGIKKRIFKPSVDTLINKKKGQTTFDDELMASRAKDVEKKTLSNRKTGKEGPVADCVADAADGKLFGMKLREPGKSEHENIDAVMDRMPNLTHVEHSMTSNFDRGYGKKLAMILAQLIKGYDILTVAAASGSKHCFITREEVNTTRSRIGGSRARPTCG